MSKSKKPGAQAAQALDPALIVRRRRLAVAAFAFSGAAALMYEVLWTRELELVFGSTVYAVSMMLAAFMSGLSLGAFLGGRWADRTSDLFALFGKLELGVGVFGMLTLPLVQALPSLYFSVYDTLRPTFVLFFLVQLLLSFLIMLVPTTLMGATFPVVSKINTTNLAELGRDVGNVYSINTLGSIAGSLLAGFLLIPLIGVKATTFAAAGLNVAVAAAMLTLGRSALTRRALVAGIIGVTLAGGAAFAVEEVAYAHNFYRIGDFANYDEYVAYRESLETVFRAEDVHGRVMVYRGADGNLYLENSGKVEGSDSALDRQTTSLLALVPMASAPRIDRVLVVGLGTGLTTQAALDAGAGLVDTVEINESVIEAAAYFVGDDVLGSERSVIHIADARNYLAATDDEYDVITSEPSYPLSTHVSHLFTREFYRLVRSRLTPDGVFCQWIPRYLLTDDDTVMMIRTFAEVFPNVSIWGSNQGADEAVDMLLIGSNGTTVPDAAAVESAVRGASPLELDFGYFAGPTDVQGLLAERPSPVNTDDRPLLEFRTPRNQIELFRAGREGLRSN